MRPVATTIPTVASWIVTAAMNEPPIADVTTAAPVAIVERANALRCPNRTVAPSIQLVVSVGSPWLIAYINDHVPYPTAPSDRNSRGTAASDASPGITYAGT